MGAEQWKPVLVFLNGGKTDLPSADGVALGAIRAKLSAMDVGVTIRAILSNVGENGIQVALRAGNFLMHSSQRIARLVVVEFGVGADGVPTGCNVTVFAGNGERPVRTSGICLLRKRAGRKHQHPHEHPEPDL
jgi:hypothetical protein